MLVDQLRMTVAAQKNREIIEPGHDSLKLDAIHQEDRNRCLIFADVVEEHVLKVLRFISSHLMILSVVYVLPFILPVRREKSSESVPLPPSTVRI